MKSILDTMLALLLVLVLGHVGISAVESSDRRADRLRLELESRRLYEGLARYYETHGRFPNAYASPGFDPETLEPLRMLGYYRGNLTSYLLDRRIDAYDSPDDRGPNQEFWLELTFAGDPSLRYVVARSDDAPSGHGKWLDGVYVSVGERLEPL